MKENNECNIVRDLLPLYIDHLTSNESELLIRTHLEGCGRCIRYYDELLEERNELQQIEDKRIGGMKRLLKRYHYETIGLVSGIMTIIICLIIAILLCFRGDSVSEQDYSVMEHYEQSSDYGKQNYTGISKLALFPDDHAMTGKILDFYYDCKGEELYQTYQIYLNCQYEPESYETEKNRLLHITDETTGTTALYSTDEFSFPGVYAMLYDDGHEYALFSDKDYSIIYIYLQGVDRRNLYFDTTLLPKDYGQYGYPFETEREPFSIYPAD